MWLCRDRAVTALWPCCGGGGGGGCGCGCAVWLCCVAVAVAVLCGCVADGSLFSVINHQTMTPFGARRLRKWLASPLADPGKIRARLNAVEALNGRCNSAFEPIIAMLKRLPDLERNITGIFFRKCSTADFLAVLQALERVHSTVTTQADIIKTATAPASAGVAEGGVPLLDTLSQHVVTQLEDVPGMLAEIDPVAAKGNDKINLFISDAAHPEMARLKAEIKVVQKALRAHLADIRGMLGNQKLNYVKVSTDGVHGCAVAVPTVLWRDCVVAVTVCCDCD